mgnify:CR=1 FL=1
MIISLSTFDKQIRDNFLKSKISLQKLGYPYFETNAIVGIHYGLVKNTILKSIKPNSILIGVPSSTTLNAMTAHFGSFLQRDVQNSSYIDSNAIFLSDCLSPAKHKLSFSSRVKDPIFFTPNSQSAIDTLKDICSNKTTYIVEDWFSTGESAINFKRELEKNGIKVENVAALVVNTKYLSKPHDLKLIHQTIKQKGSINDKELSLALLANFEGYSKYKLSRFVFEFSNESKQKDLINSLFEMKDKYLERNLISSNKLEKLHEDFKKDISNNLTI